MTLEARELTMWPEGPGRPRAPGVPGSPWKGHNLTFILIMIYTLASGFYADYGFAL